jgi:uncharacterized protein (DUF1778 family)
MSTRDYSRKRIKTAQIAIRLKPEDKEIFEATAAFRRRTLTNWFTAIAHADYAKALAEGMPPYVPSVEPEDF